MANKKEGSTCEVFKDLTGLELRNQPVSQTCEVLKTSQVEPSYSVLKFFAGFPTAALIAWKLTVTIAMHMVASPAAINIHQLVFMR